MVKVAIIGTQGVPAKYGGFESLVENIIGDNCSDGIQYTVFCSGIDMDSKLKSYKGCRLKYVPLHANGMQSVPYDILSMMRTIRGYDTILILGTSGCCFLPILKRLCHARIIVNIDGIEHKREKWGKVAKWMLRHSEKAAVRYSDVIIADNKGISQYVKDTYGRDAEIIAYGGDNAVRDVSEQQQMEILRQYGLESDCYAITVCRIEPENNTHIVLEAFKRNGRPLVYIGNWEHSNYARYLKKQYAEATNIRMLDSIYDLDTLYALRKHSHCYVHGHSAGGTNPSLVEAMSIGCRILCFDVVYNRETTHGKALYFSDVESLTELLDTEWGDYSQMREIARRCYTWATIAKAYERLYTAQEKDRDSR